MKVNTKTLPNAKVVEWLQGHTCNHKQLSESEYEVTVIDVPLIIVHDARRGEYTFKDPYMLPNLSRRVAEDLGLNYIDLKVITHWMWRACGHYDLVDKEFLELRDLIGTGFHDDNDALIAKAGKYADRVPIQLLRDMARNVFTSEGVLHVTGVSGGYAYITKSYLYRDVYFNVDNIKAMTRVVDHSASEKIVTIPDNAAIDNTVVAYVVGYEDDEVYLEYVFEKAIITLSKGTASTLSVVCFILDICNKRYPTYSEYVEYVRDLSAFIMADPKYDPVLGNYDDVDLTVKNSPYRVLSDENYICENAVREAINVTRGLSYIQERFK